MTPVEEEALMRRLYFAAVPLISDVTPHDAILAMTRALVQLAAHAVRPEQLPELVDGIADGLTRTANDLRRRLH